MLVLVIIVVFVAFAVVVVVLLLSCRLYTGPFWSDADELTAEVLDAVPPADD